MAEKLKYKDFTQKLIGVFRGRCLTNYLN